MTGYSAARMPSQCKQGDFMPLPKRRHSKTRGRKRRTHYKLSTPTKAVCPQCREAKLPHRICPHCGYYKGREIVAVEGE
jgi:large subunit ribosomal protein L32